MDGFINVFLFFRLVISLTKKNLPLDPDEYFSADHLHTYNLDLSYTFPSQALKLSPKSREVELRLDLEPAYNDNQILEKFWEIFRKNKTHLLKQIQLFETVFWKMFQQKGQASPMVGFSRKKTKFSKLYEKSLSPFGPLCPPTRFISNTATSNFSW